MVECVVERVDERVDERVAERVAERVVERVVERAMIVAEATTATDVLLVESSTFLLLRSLAPTLALGLAPAHLTSSRSKISPCQYSGPYDPNKM